MKRQPIIVAILFSIVAVVLINVASVYGAATPRGGNVAPVYYVIASDAPTTFKRRLRHTWVCDGTADDVQFQAAIDVAEASGVQGTVEISPGTYSFTSRIFIGYSGETPSQNVGCSLVGVGRVVITYAGTEYEDCSGFLINVAPSIDINGRRIAHLRLNCADKINGLFTNAVNRGKVEDIFVSNSKYIGLLANNSWFGDYEGISVFGTQGMAALFLRCNGARIRKLIHYESDNTTMPEVWSYRYENFSEGSWSDTFQPLETLTSPGKTDAIFLGWMSEPNSTISPVRMVVAYVSGSPTRFLHGNTVTGGTSGHTADIFISATHEEYDVTSGIFITSQQFSLRDYAPENLDYDGDPLLLIMSHGGHVDGIRWENTSAVADNPADTLIKLNECYGVTVENGQGFAGPTRTGNRANAYDCQVTDNGATGTVDDMIASTWGNNVLEGDSVFIWDGVGGMTDGVYTVSAGPTSTSFGIDEDPGATTGADACWVYGISLVDRLCPDVIVDLEECRGCTVRNISYRGCRTSLVKIDSSCVNTVLDTVRDSTVGIAFQDNDFWLVSPHPTLPINDSGSATKTINTQVYNGLAPGSVTYTGNTDDIQKLEETSGASHKTTLVLQDLIVTITDAGAGDEGWGTELLYTFPEGNILILGVVSDLWLDATDIYDTDDVIGETAAGDFAIGTAAITDEAAMNGTEVDLIASTATVLSSGVDGTLHGQLAANLQKNGTSSAVTVHFNQLFDAGEVASSTTVAVRGTVTIHWVELGDY